MTDVRISKLLMKHDATVPHAPYLPDETYKSDIASTQCQWDARNAIGSANSNLGPIPAIVAEKSFFS
jgi:hypothetical protein